MAFKLHCFAQYAPMHTLTMVVKQNHRAEKEKFIAKIRNFV